MTLPDAGSAALIGGAALAAAYGLHRTALWMEGRGWIYYRKGGAGGVTNAVAQTLGEIHGVLEPERARHVETVEERKHQDDWGEGKRPRRTIPPGGGGRR